MTYIENPKTKGSGIYACIPQAGRCPNECEDCFFQSDERSYLAPLTDNLPNMPDASFINENGYVIRVNDGNDSNVNRARVIGWTHVYNHRFFNTAIPKDLEGFPGPVVLTVNPGRQTNTVPHMLSVIPKNLMFLRIRTNTWNRSVVDAAVDYYTDLRVPCVLTFMAYHSEDSIPPEHKEDYVYRKRTLNEYWAISTLAWRVIMKRYEDNPFVYSCGTEGERGNTKCERCGNCLREYFATKVRLQETGVV